MLILNSECRRLAATAKFEEAKLKYDELFEKLDMDIIVNKQIIGFFKLYKYSNSSYDLEKLWELLSYNDVEFEQRILFSREELEILSLIAWEEEKNCKRNGIKLLDLILEKEGKQRGTYYSRTAIIKRNMVRMLKNDKEYDRSNKLLTECIKNMFIENESGLLINMLDYISIIEEERGDRKKAAEICKIMFYTSELYNRYSTAMATKKYFEENFNKNELWY